MGAPGMTQAAFRDATQGRAASRSAAQEPRRMPARQWAAARIGTLRDGRRISSVARFVHDGAQNQARRATMATERMAINGIELDVLRRGAGTPVLLLHGMDTVHPQARFLDLLGGDAEIIAPSSPGFGNTKRPADFDTIYDLVHPHLSVLD